MITIYTFIFFLNIIIGLIPLILVTPNKTTVSFSISVSFLTAWTLSNFLIFSTINHLFWNQMAYISAALFIASQIYFALHFPLPKKKISFRKHALIVIPTVIAIISSLSPLHIKSMKSPLDITFGPLHSLWALYFIGFFIFIIFICNKKKKIDPFKRTKINFYLTALILFLILATLCNLILPSLFNETHFYKIGPLTAVLFNITIAYTIFKYQLFDIKILINKIIASIMCLVIATFGYISISWIYKLYLPNTISSIYTTLISLYLIIIALSFDTIRLKLQSTAEKLFLRGKYDYRKVILEFSDYSSKCTHLNDLIDQVYTLLSDTLETSNVHIYLPEWFDKFKETSKKICYFPPKSNSTVSNIIVDPLIINEIEAEKKSLILFSDLSTISASKLNDDSCSILLPSFNEEGNLICLITLGNKMSETKFKEEDYQLYITLSNQIKVTLIQIKQLRVRTEMDMAQKIQSEIIPQKFSLPNCSTATYLRSSDEVGGDFFDIHSKQNNNWIILGDVTGHGMGSGMVMLMIQSIFSSLIHQNKLTSPGEINKEANAILCQNFERLTEPRPISIVTLFTNDGKNYEFHGNHENIFIYKHKDKKVIQKAVNNLPIGIGLTQDIDDKYFESSKFSLSEGDILFLATDGLSEAYQDGNPKSKIQFETKKIEKIIKKFSDLPVEILKEKFIKEINLFTNQVLLDDLTFIIIKFNKKKLPY
jgi:serine phosphatase RsbU (regulator of sigma subunit)